MEIAGKEVPIFGLVVLYKDWPSNEAKSFLPG